MDSLSLLLGLGIGGVAGGLVAWTAARARATRIQVELETRLRASEEKLQEQKRLQEEATARLTETFKSLAYEALSKNNESFLQLANQSLSTTLTQAQGELELRRQAVEGITDRALQSINESLSRTLSQVQSELELRRQAVEAMVKPLAEALSAMERERQSAYGSLKQLVESMARDQEALARETRNLAQALRTPHVRGRWGEMTLRRVAELAGMVPHCDFLEQETLDMEAGSKRPDMVVHLPNHRLIAVDAKTPLEAYIQAIEAQSEDERSAALRRHARQVRDRVQELSSKSYWAALGFTPEFVVLFLPGEFLLASALREAPELVEHAMQSRVVIATPFTLVSLLHAVAYGWRQEALAENAMQVSRLGRDLHDRLVTWASHLVKLRESLIRCVDAFNDSVGSLEHRVLVSARRFKEMGVGGDKEVPLIEPVELRPRALSAMEPPADATTDGATADQQTEHRRQSSLT